MRIRIIVDGKKFVTKERDDDIEEYSEKFYNCIVNHPHVVAFKSILEDGNIILLPAGMIDRSIFIFEE